MSETKHSPEPWALASSLDYSPAINDADGDCLVAATDFPNTADRRRIVACVNACAGIPTEALEAGAVRDALDAAALACAYGPVAPLVGTATPGAQALADLRRCLRALGRLP